MMDRRFPLVLIASAVFASCVAGLFYRVAAARSRPAARVIMKPVVVAILDLPVGVMIRAVDLKLVQMPETSLPRNSFSRVEDVQSRAVTGKIYQEEPILQDRLAAAGSPSGLVSLIESGKRAVGVRVNDVISVAGFVQPGMRVDVVLTGNPPGSQNSISRTVLQNILVLSSGQVLQAEPKGQAINATVVTLSVDPAQAEVLILASAEGKVQLVLRNSSDSRIDQPRGIQLSTLYGLVGQAEALDPVPSKHPASSKRAAGELRIEHPVEGNRAEPIPAIPAVPVSIEMIRGSKKSADPIEYQTPSRKSPK
jgi:pilus assembly protein CpaB